MVVPINQGSNSQLQIQNRAWQPPRVSVNFSNHVSLALPLIIEYNTFLQSMAVLYSESRYIELRVDHLNQMIDIKGCI